MQKRIKAVITERYEVALYETDKGFEILYDSVETGLKVSESIKDYYTVDMMFDMKVRELEGH